MDFLALINNSPFILTEGSIIERLSRDQSVPIDPHILNASLVLDEKGKSELAATYRDYIDIGKQFDLPFITLAPTWRVNTERVKKAGLPDVADLTSACCNFMKDIRSEYGDYAKKILIGGLMAPRGDAYDPSDALSTDDAGWFHREMAILLSENGVDFILASTFPSFTEALGLAMAVSSVTNCVPYVISFVVRPDGTLPDGTPLNKAIERIDTVAETPPACYFLNCVHPSVFESAFESETNVGFDLSSRIPGLQANTSRRSLDELDDLPFLDTEEPEPFADSMIGLHKKYGLKILGGCCGTDPRHINKIAQKYALI